MELPVVVTLKYPLTVGNQTVEELRFERRPNGNDLGDLVLTSVTVRDMLKIAARLCGHAPAVLGKLDAEDVVTVTGVIGTFLGSGQETGD